MATITIAWTQTAIRQRNLVFEYWNERNQSYAYSRKLYAKINERTKILKQNPEIGKITVYQNTRVLSLGHYSIFYRIENTKIFITGFWDNRQNPGKLLKALSPF
ncbi:type II toxin-antitoxin system RelE/ParE family toxin [Flavobacterium akiainvivens]|uniref:type II toxin-antitoxin system RelE/ParE family toxin n=1 Tax=Flavobacterium akiainvivens TaxID=1202724 RepID=UPI0006C83645|nr:ParE toxin of type II toxin-antitoxin system, parDE [Flavobacterium akiainvivens]